MNFILIDLIFLFFPFRPDGGVYCNTHDEGVSYGSLCVSTMVHLMCANLFYRIECKKFNSHKIFMYTSLQEKHVYMQRSVKECFMAWVYTFFQKEKRKEKRKLRKISLRQLGSSLNPGYRGAELFVGCPMVCAKSFRINKTQVWVQSWNHQVTSCSASLSLFHLSNENNKCSKGLFWRWNEIVYGKDLAHWSVFSKMVMPFTF